MKFAWLTDIHLNFIDKKFREQFYQEIVDIKCDGILISGDIAEATDNAELLLEMYTYIERPIYFVLGNHDYYRGNVSEVRSAMKALTKKHECLNWLPVSKIKDIKNNTFIIGQDGWADGRYGDYAHSTVELNDSVYIQDLSQAKLLSKEALLKKMRQLADADAKQLEKQMIQAAKQKAKSIIVLTHVPPFAKVCAPRGNAQDESLLPFYSSKTTGNVLLKLSKKHPDIEFLVLCGHTHSSALYQPRENLIVKVGQAEYGEPQIQEIVVV